MCVFCAPPCVSVCLNVLVNELSCVSVTFKGACGGCNEEK